ncbi:MAG: 1-deoxy-D-xylulose-5-phosphate reductoisomerase, partial [Bacteroidota bacterium]
DTKTFRNLALAYEALEKGGNAPCILNAANEIAVDYFLKDEIRFLEIPDVVADCMAKIPYIASPVLEDYLHTDQETRQVALSLV